MATSRTDTDRVAALVYNPVKADANRVRSAVELASAQKGWRQPLLFETTPEDLGQGPTREAVDAGVDVVLAAGGDGTVRAVSEAIAGTGVPLAIVPSGTGNLLARNLGLPLGDPTAMVRAALGANTASIDIGWAHLTRPGGEITRHAFVVLGGMGLDATMIANTNPDLKRAVGWVAYVDGAARALVRAQPFRVSYRVDTHRRRTARVQSVLFANCGALPAGIALIPGASITDGRLDVAVIQPAGWLGWVGVGRKVWWHNSVLRRRARGRRGRAGRDQSVHYLRGDQADVVAEIAQPVQLDGDEFGQALEMRCTMERGGLIVSLPEGHDVSSL